MPLLEFPKLKMMLITQIQKISKKKILKILIILHQFGIYI